jgi:hypothetical protein
MNRELGSFEQALVITDQHAPFHIVSVLQLENAPSPHILRQAFGILQNRHPFLSVCLVPRNGKYHLASLVEPSPPLHVLPRWNDEHWLYIAEVELGTRLDVFRGPLFRCTYLYREGDPHSDLIFSFSHFISDSASISQLMSELLTICNSLLNQTTVPLVERFPAPASEIRFPPAYQGLQLTLHILRYAIQQVVDEISYRLRTRGKRTASVHQHPSRGHILSIQIPEDMTESFAQRARREGVTLNSALNAAMLLALNRNLYAGQETPMRTFTFADLRPYVKPPLSNEDLACYVSMLRYTVPVSGGLELWVLARSLHKKIYSSLKSGDKFVAAVMAESLMKLVTRLSSFRMSATGLNYNGVSPVQESYDRIKVAGLHGFVSAYDLGPEFSAQAQIFNGELCWDFIYLEADMSQDEARGVVEEIKRIFHQAVEK